MQPTSMKPCRILVEHIYTVLISCIIQHALINSSIYEGLVAYGVDPGKIPGWFKKTAPKKSARRGTHRQGCACPACPCAYPPYPAYPCAPPQPASPGQRRQAQADEAGEAGEAEEAGEQEAPESFEGEIRRISLQEVDCRPMSRTRGFTGRMRVRCTQSTPRRHVADLYSVTTRCMQSTSMRPLRHSSGFS